VAIATVAVRTATTVGSALAAAGAAHAAWNLTRFRRPPADPPPVHEPVALLLPVRNEATRVEPCLRSVLAQTGLRDMRVLVLDDGSVDGTLDVVHRIVGDDARVQVLAGKPLPAGWHGKAHACQQLADASDASVLVFVDADVVLAPHAVAATVAMVRWTGLDLVSPYPRQLAVGAAERLVQPLLQWSFLTMLPLRVAERSARPALSAANGQLLAVDAHAYRRAGGHAGVRDQMLEDLALLRSVKRSGGRGGVVDGSRLATCRMYDGWPAVREGYTKSLWSAFGSPSGSVAACALLGLAYVVPPLAALRGSRVGLVGYVTGVAGRVIVGRRVRARVLPDALAHPVSIAAFCWLAAQSSWRRRANRLAWKGRPV
jgi:hypothetical protein